jgi:F5/8 type C domain/PEP-CTERM motif
MTLRTSIIVATSACLMALAPSAKATLMYDPAGVSTNMGTFSGAIGNVINQSGQVPGYVSGVTDFATYTASATATAGNANDLWTSGSGATTGNVDFDLGGSVEIDAFAVWALVSTNGDNIEHFTLLASNDASFTTTTLLGNFTPTYSPGSPIPATVVNFALTTASFVRMEITSNNGGPDAGFNEAAFGTDSSAPEPSSLWMAGIGIVSALGYRLRRNPAR